MQNLNNFIIEKLKVNSDSKISKVNPEDPNTWGEGDILAGTWGYNMTIPEFFKVIKKTAKQFTVIKLSKKLASGHYNGSFTAIPDDSKLEKDLKETPIKARISKNNYLKIDSCYVHLWDGKPLYGNDMD